MGIALSPEGRHVFPRMTVLENLELGAYLRRGRERHRQTTSTGCSQLFPRLKERERRRAARCPAASSRCSRSAAR